MVERRKWWWKGVCILGIALAFTLLLTTSPTLAWWNESWKYRRPITIQSDNALSDYQVLVQLDGSNFDFSKAKSDGSDIRFVDEDDATKLNYWIEEWDASSESAKIWVKVPSIPAGEKTIYLYYNNSEAVSESDGDAVFEFFDDFEDNDISDWNAGDNIGSVFSTKPSVENGYVRSTGEKQGMHKSLSLSLSAYALRYRIYFSGDDSYNYLFSCLIHTGGSPAEYYSHLCTQGKPSHEGMQVRKDDFWEGDILARDDTETFTGDVWHTVEFAHKPDGKWSGEHNGNDVDFEYANVADTSYSTFSSINLCFRLASQRCDWILVRKYTSPEPSTSVGAEEEYTPPSSPQDPNLQITCILPFTLKISLTIPAESGFIFIGTSPDKFCYAFAHQGSGNYTLTASFIKVNETYYVKACDNEGVNCTNLSTFTCEGEVEVEEKNFTTAFNKLMQGGDVLNITKLGEVVPSIYTSILSDMFWAMFFGSIFLAYWIRQEDVLLPSIVGMIVGGVLIMMLPPSAQHIAYILLTLSIAGTLYSIIKAKR